MLKCKKVVQLSVVLVGNGNKLPKMNMFDSEYILNLYF